MDRHKLILTLLIISLIMSVISIVLNVAILKMDLDFGSTAQSNLRTSSSDSAQIGLVVESAPAIGEGSGADG